jgi:hypothetical protein
VRDSFFTQSIRSLFGLDLRALALLRIFLSLIVLLDLLFRYDDLKAFYTKSGVLPVEALFQFHWNPFYFSLLTTNDNYYIQSGWFLLNFVCILCLLIGYRTKFFTIAVWIFLISIHNRTPLVMQAGDHLLRMLVFWAIFLPWGHLLSVDAHRQKANRKTYSFESFAGLAYLCQVVFLYYFAALLKSSGEWRSDFTAIYYALSIDQIVRPVGEWLYPHYELLKVMTAGVYYVELILPLLLFIPLYHAWFRILVIVGMVMLQLGIFATLNAGLFTAISIVMMVGLLPSPVLNKVWPKVSTSLSQQTENLGRLFFRFRTFRKNRSSPLPKPPLASEIIVALSLLYVLGWNMGTVGRKVIPDNLLWIGYLFKLEQHWAMFAPTVFKNDGWFIYQGTTEEGIEIDLLRDGTAVNYDKPGRVADLVKNDRWRKYGENIIMKSNSQVRPYWCNFLLNEWNFAHPDQSIRQLKIIYMHEETLPEYRTAEVERWELCECTASP